MEAKKSFAVHLPKGANLDAIKKMESTLFSLWGDGKGNEMVEFFPFFSYFGFEDEDDYTPFMEFTVGYLCQVFFGHQKRPSKKQIRDVKKLLWQMGSVQFVESRWEVDGHVYVSTKTVQFVKCLFTKEVTTGCQISETMGSADRPDFVNLRPTDLIEIAFFKPFFDKEVTF